MSLFFSESLGLLAVILRFSYEYAAFFLVVS